MAQIKVPADVENGNYVVNTISGMWYKADSAEAAAVLMSDHAMLFTVVGLSEADGTVDTHTCPELDEAGETIANLRAALAKERRKVASAIDMIEEARRERVQARRDYDAVVRQRESVKGDYVVSQRRVREVIVERDEARQERDAALRSQGDAVTQLAKVTDEDELVLVQKVVKNGNAFAADEVEETWRRRGDL